MSTSPRARCEPARDRGGHRLPLGGMEARPPADGKPAKAAVTATQSKVASPEETAAWRGLWKDLLGRL
ncbi:hypothetical protein NJC10_06545 [Micrococcus sp. M4NT]|uniref:hypothetical protein n=1 Tax=Micrococcus sp. M4NT TaxID=2957501 RepID=UPI0029B5B845|nr:hypothetical protein [Micrococcus sp. M4NT]MDX2341323.1 hypothetical protein [Micrococcus sp. M4NT]